MPNGDEWIQGSGDPDDVYLALLDVLGLRQMIRGNSLREVASGLRVSRAAINAAIPDDIDEDYEPDSIMYSDSVLFWVEGTTADHLQSLTRTLASFLGALVNDGILMRGSLVCGELSVSDDQEIIVGQGLVRAYELEQGQKWAGVVVDPAIIRSDPPGLAELDEDGLLVKYDKVPWNDNPSPRPHTVLCWPQKSGATIAEITEEFRDWFNPLTEDGRAKFKATMDFFEEHG